MRHAGVPCTETDELEYENSKTCSENMIKDTLSDAIAKMKKRKVKTKCRFNWVLN